MLLDTVTDNSCGLHVKGPGVERGASPLVEQLGSTLAAEVIDKSLKVLQWGQYPMTRVLTCCVSADGSSTPVSGHY